MQDLFVVSAEGGAPRQLTAGGPTHSEPAWSPDGRQLLCNAALAPDSSVITPFLRVVDLEGWARTVVGHDWGHCGSAAWLPDGQRIVFTGVPRQKPIGSKSDLYVAPVDGSTPPENRTADSLYGVGGDLQDDMPAGLLQRLAKILVTRDGRAAYVQAQRGGAVHIVRVALTGQEQVETVVAGERTCLLQALGPDERSLFFAVSDFWSPLELAQCSSDGGDERQLTTVNQAALASLARVVVEPLHFLGSDGVAVEGWMIMPPAGQAPYPTILYIHGGPHGAFGSVYHFDTQLLVGAGYGVLMVNHRASSGYGDAFGTAIKGDWGNLDYLDLMAGVDTAIARGYADPDRLGVCGLSGGGNLSCWIVGHTDRFKAAVPENPVTNWLSFYGVSDIGLWFAVEELGGHPHELPEVYARCSPITAAHRCTTPTLLIQGEADHRCPAEQSEQFYAVLKANGCPVEMVRLPASPHAGSIAGPPVLRRAQNEALLAWMNRYVLGQQPQALPLQGAQGAALAAFIQAQMKELQVPGVAIGLLIDGTIQHAGFGVTSLDHPLPVTPETLFQIGSISKTFTATALMCLVEQGQLDLDAPVRAYAPGFRVQDEAVSAAVTVRHLLTHLCGWEGDFFVDTGSGADALASYVERMAGQEQIAPLGEHYSYNNAAFSLAGYLIEQVTALPFEAVVAETIFKPVGLAKAFYQPSDIMVHCFAVGHNSAPAGPKVATPWALPRAVAPAGGIVTTVDDLLRYAQVFLREGRNEAGQQVLSGDSVRAMLTPHAPASDPDESVGLAWHLREIDGVRAFGHGGGTNGQISLLTVVPAHNFACALFTNSDRGGELIQVVEKWILRSYLGLRPPEPVVSTASGAQLAPYAGHYGRSFAEVVLKFEEDQLSLQMIQKKGFPTEDAPVGPPSPWFPVGLTANGNLIVLDGPFKNAQGQVIRLADGRVGWLRISGRLHRRVEG